MKRAIVPAILVAAAVAVAIWASAHISRVTSFSIPIAYVLSGDRFYVLEKEENTVLAFRPGEPGAALQLDGRYEIEKDDPQYFYMVRHLHRGPSGVMVHSFIYEQKTKRFLGYRFRQYQDFSRSPQEIFTIFLPRPEDVPEFSYAPGPDGQHYFVHNLPGHPCLWKVPAEGGAVVRGEEVPSTVTEMGWTNQTSSYWTALAAGGNGHLFAASGEIGQVVEFSPGGKFIRKIGTVGFASDELLAPSAVFFLPREGREVLTVSSSGNRTWIEFNPEGEVAGTINPLENGYPFDDILVGHIYAEPSGRLLSFDLVNKCLLFPGKPFRASSLYRRTNYSLLAFGYGLSALLLIAASLCRKFFSWVRRLRFPLFFQLLLLFAPLVLGGLIASDWVRQIMEDELKAESIRRLENLAWAVVNTVELKDLLAIQKPEDRESPTYEKINRTVNGIVDRAHVEHSPRWIIHKIRDGHFYFGISGWRGPIYEPFIVPADRKMFRDALALKSRQYGAFTDDQGEWFSYLSPILDEKGNVVYVLELYRPTEEMKRVERDVARKMAEAVGGTVLGVVVLAAGFSWLFTRPIKKLIRGTEIIRTGNFDHRIGIASRDEMGDLARAFDQMAGDLKTYTGELARTTAEKERIQSELRLAREMQQGILPHLFPPSVPPKNVEIVARMEPAREIGGDFFDFFMVDEHHLGVVIADVSGKGVPAGLFMMVARSLIRNNALHNPNPADTLGRANQILSTDNPSSSFVTVFYFVCNIKSGEITFCNAGHNWPVVIGGKEPRLLKPHPGVDTNPALGIFEAAAYRAARLSLAPGESLLLYTDGITEAINPKKELFGEERLLHFIQAGASLSNRELSDGLFAEITRYAQGLEQFDDMTVVLFKFLTNNPSGRHRF